MASATLLRELMLRLYTPSHRVVLQLLSWRLPRLELYGALLLVKLTDFIVKNLLSTPSSLNFWSDSKVLLDWLKAHPSKWQTFVANRVSEIQTTFPTASCRHVISKENPADPASRGLFPDQLADLSLWWHVPVGWPTLSVDYRLDLWLCVVDAWPWSPYTRGPGGSHVCLEWRSCRMPFRAYFTSAKSL